jgi:salicylate hydroxylase
VVEPDNISIRRWKSGEVIGYTKLVPEFRETFGAPYYVVHRAHFHDALYRRAVELGVKVQTGAKVVDYDLGAPSITLEDGSKQTADLVVAAEGCSLRLLDRSSINSLQASDPQQES